jgi:hypothetical protein
MNIVCPVSLGELVDKITILMIKEQKITDQDKLKFIGEELKELCSQLSSLSLTGMDEHLNDLKDINLALWEIEDDIRECERASTFDEKFIELARAVYKTNDKRFAIKNKINQTYGSSIREMKSYKEY